jgi:tetratricopeptide (TPR) repeat protein
VRVLIARGEAHRAAGSAGAAIADFSRAVELDAEVAHVAYKEVGATHWGMKQLDEAQEAFGRALEAYPACSECWTSLARVLHVKHGNGAADALRAVSIDVSDEHTLHCRADGLSAIGDLDEALKEYDAVLAQNPNHLWSWIERGRVGIASGNLRGAISDLSQALDLEPMAYAAYAERGLAYARLGEFGSALGDLDRAIELVPESPAVFDYRGRARAELGDLSGALEDANRAVELSPDGVGYLIDRATISLRPGDLAAAVADLDRSLEINPELVDRVHDQQGVLLNYLGRYEDAVPVLRDVATRQEGRPEALYNLAVAVVLSKGFAEAGEQVDAARTVLQQEYESGVRFVGAYGLAGIEALAGNREGAFELLREACQHDAQPKTWALADPPWNGLREHDEFQEIVSEE